MTYYRRVTASAVPPRMSGTRRTARCERCGTDYKTNEPSRRPLFRGLLLCPDCRTGDGQWFMEKVGT